MARTDQQTDAHQTPRQTKWVRNILIGLLIFVLILLMGVIGAIWWLGSNGGAKFLENQLNNRDLPAGQSVEISGLSGDVLDEFSIDRIAVSDVDGPWLVAEDIRMDWNAWDALRRKQINIEDIDAASVDVLRRPILAPRTEPVPDFQYTVRVEDADIAALILRDPVMGQGATLRIDASGGANPDGSVNARLIAVRTDAAGDAVDLDFTRGSNGDLSGDFKLDGARGGTVATLLRAPDGVDLTGLGAINGTRETGSGSIAINFGATEQIAGTLGWTPQAATLEGSIVTTDWPLLESARAGLGDKVNVAAQLDRTLAPNSFTAQASSLNFNAEFSGALKSKGGLPDLIYYDIRSDKISAIAPLPEGVSIGSGRVKGQLRLDDMRALDADVTVNAIDTPQLKATKMSGPLTLQQTGSDTYNFTSTLTIENPVAMQDLPLALSNTANIKASGALNLSTGSVSRLDAMVTSGANRVTAQGTVAFDAATIDLSGTAVTTLKAMGSVPAGSLDTRYALRKTPSSDLAVDATGQYDLSNPVAAPLGDVLGRRVAFDVAMTPQMGGVRIQKADVQAANLRASAVGFAGDQLDIQAEVQVTAPLSYNGVDIGAGALASATVTGSRADPNLRLDSTLESVAYAGRSATDVRIRADLRDLINAPKGPVRIEAMTEYGPLDLSADLASDAKGYAVSDASLSVGALQSRGNLRLTENGVAIGELSLNLPQDGEKFAQAQIALTDAAGVQGIDLDIAAKDVAYKNYAFETLTLKASGTLNALTGDIAVRGILLDQVVGRQFQIASPVTLSREDEIYSLRLSPTGDVGSVQFGSAAPVVATYSQGNITLAAPLLVQKQPVTLNYAKTQTDENLTLLAKNIPINVLPLPGALQSMRGRFDADIKLSTDAGAVGGEGTITLNNLRSVTIPKNESLSGALRFDVRPRAVDVALELNSPLGFTGSGDMRLALIPASTLAGIRADMTAPVAGTLEAKGAAAALLNLILVDDADPKGELGLQVSISGTAANPQVNGLATGQALALELPQLGTRMRQGRFTANFTNDTLAVTDVFIADSDDGTLAGGGEFRLAEFGQPLGKLDVVAKNFRALDRKDFEGKVTGTLGVLMEPKKTTLTGDVNIKRAEVKQFVGGTAAVVVLDIEEINGRGFNVPENEVRHPKTPIYLDVRVRAPRRIFVRTRGLDVELEMDVRIKGTVDSPELYGTANVVRGGYKIAGKELAFDEGGVEFDGAIGDAKVNLVAKTETTNINATVNITGTVMEPEIELSSSPERPKDEILSALLFGRSATELSAIEAAQLAGALAQFSGKGGGFDLMGGLRDALGVGQLSVGLAEDGSATVTGGRYLAKNVYLQVFTGGGADASGAVIDWEIRRNLSLRSRVQADSEQAFSLKYKKDF